MVARPRHRHRRTTLTLALLAAMAMVVSACGGGTASEASNTTEPAPGSAGEPATTYPAGVLKLSDPGNAGVLAYAKETGVLEDRLAEVNVTVEWGGTSNAGSETIDAVNSGDLTALGGAASVIVGSIGRQTDVKVFVASDPHPTNTAIIVPEDSPVQSVADLAGRRVAVNAAGHGDYVTLIALENAGVPVEDVERVGLRVNDAATAFNNGNLDAWATFATLLTQAKRGGARVLVNEGDLEGDHDIFVWSFRTDFIEKHPAAVAVFFDVYQSLVEEQRDDPAKFINVFETEGPRALSGDVLADQIEVDRLTPSIRWPTDEDRQSLQAVAATFAQYGVLPEEYDTSNHILTASEVSELQAVLPR